MFKKLLNKAKDLVDKIRGQIKDDWSGRQAKATGTYKTLAGTRKEIPFTVLSKRARQNGQNGCFGQSKVNRALKGLPTTRKEQNRLGWWTPDLPSER